MSLRTLAAASATFFLLGALAAAQGAPPHAGAAIQKERESVAPRPVSLFLGQSPSPFSGTPAPFGNNPGAQPQTTPQTQVIRVMRVRVESLENAQRAASIVRRLESEGYSTIETIVEDGKHNVYVGEFTEEQKTEAGRLMGDLQQNGFKGARLFWVPKTIVIATPTPVPVDPEKQLLTMREIIDLSERQKAGALSSDQARRLQELINETNVNMADVRRDYDRLLAQVDADRKAREKADADAKNINRQINGFMEEFLQAIQQKNFIRAEQAMMSAAALDPNHVKVVEMGNRLEAAKANEIDIQAARARLDSIFQAANKAEGDGDWDVALERWQDVINFPVQAALTPSQMEMAKAGADKAQGKIKIGKYEESRFKVFVRWMIWGTLGGLAILAMWFLYSRVTEHRRVVKIMEHHLPDMVLPEFAIGGDPGVAQIEAPQVLALPGASGAGEPKRGAAGRDSNSSRRASRGASNPARSSHQNLKPTLGSSPSAASPSSQDATRRASSSRAHSASSLEPSSSPAPAAPKAPDLDPMAPRSQQAPRHQADPKTVVTGGPAPTPAPGGFSAGTQRPASTPAQPAAEKGPAKLDLGGLPDLPDFDGIAGGANPPARPLSAAPASSPDVHDSPTNLDFEASNQPTQMLGLEGLNFGGGSTPAAPPRPAAAPSRPAAAAAAASNGANGVFFEQDFRDGGMGNWEGSFDFATLGVIDANGSGQGAAPARALKYEKTTGSGQVYYHCEFPNARGRVTVEFDLCCPEKNRYLLGLYLEKDRDFRRSIHTVVHCSNPRAKASLRLQGKPANYLMGHWSKVKYEINMHRGTLTAYVDGAKVVDKEPVDNMPDSINTLAIRDNHPTTGVLLLGNIKIYPTAGGDDDE